MTSVFPELQASLRESVRDITHSVLGGADRGTGGLTEASLSQLAEAILQDDILRLVHDVAHTKDPAERWFQIDGERIDAVALWQSVENDLLTTLDTFTQPLDTTIAIAADGLYGNERGYMEELLPEPEPDIVPERALSPMLIEAKDLSMLAVLEKENARTPAAKSVFEGLFQELFLQMASAGRGR